jgi:hypothetical protein
MPARQFVHCVMINLDDIGSTYHTATAERDRAGRFTVTSRNPSTGSTHTRFFDSGREFVVWHYAQQGLVVSDDEPWEYELQAVA